MYVCMYVCIEFISLKHGYTFINDKLEWMVHEGIVMSLRTVNFQMQFKNPKKTVLVQFSDPHCILVIIHSNILTHTKQCNSHYMNN